MQKGIRFRAYPNKAQENLINRTFGCCRLIYNRGLAMRKDAYANGEKTGYNQTSSMLTALKSQDEYAFLKEVDAIALQQSLRDLDAAFKNFFSKRAKHPVFKSKKDHHQSYRTLNQNNGIRICGNSIKLPKLGFVKIKQSMKVEHINNATVERTPTGKYFVVLNLDFEPEHRPCAGGTVGIDMGIRNLACDSSGKIIPNNKYLERSMRKLKKQQRALARKKKGSANYNKQRKRIALLHEKVTNQRNDFLQKQSTILIRENQTICIEDISVKSLLLDKTAAARKRQNINRAQLSASWNKFFNMLEYKAQWYGRTLVKAPKGFPSSETCHTCGHTVPEIKDLKIRKWECPACHTQHDRDVNAAINILAKGLEMIA